MSTTYVLDGARIRTLEEFWDILMDAFDGEGRRYFGRNLSALADCLDGGPGHPGTDDFVVEWRDHAVSREGLGYPETVRQLELRLTRCHPDNRPAVRADLEAARAGRGPTVFDWLVEIFEDRAPGRLKLR